MVQENINGDEIYKTTGDYCPLLPLNPFVPYIITCSYRLAACAAVALRLLRTSTNLMKL